MPSENHLLSLGRFTVAWSQLEASVEFAIWHYARLEGTAAAIITTAMPFSGMVKCLRALIRENQDAKFVTNIIPILDELNTIRNDIVHNIWLEAAEPEHGAIALNIRRKSHGRWVCEHKKTTVRDINDTVARVGGFTHLILDHLQRQGANLDAFSDIYKPTDP